MFLSNFIATVLLKCNIALTWQWLAYDSNGLCSTFTSYYRLTCECWGVNRSYIALELDPLATITSALDKPLCTQTSQYSYHKDCHQLLACNHSTARLTLDNNSRIVPWMSLKKKLIQTYKCSLITPHLHLLYKIVIFCKQCQRRKESKGKEHGAVDETSLEQQIHESDYHMYIDCEENWSPNTSGTEFYVSQAGRPAGWQAFMWKFCGFRNFKNPVTWL